MKSTKVLKIYKFFIAVLIAVFCVVTLAFVFPKTYCTEAAPIVPEYRQINDSNFGDLYFGPDGICFDYAGGDYLNKYSKIYLSFLHPNVGDGSIWGGSFLIFSFDGTTLSDYIAERQSRWGWTDSDCAGMFGGFCSLGLYCSDTSVVRATASNRTNVVLKKELFPYYTTEHYTTGMPQNNCLFRENKFLDNVPSNVWCWFLSGRLYTFRLEFEPVGYDAQHPIIYYGNSSSFIAGAANSYNIETEADIRNIVPISIKFSYKSDPKATQIDIVNVRFDVPSNVALKNFYPFTRLLQNWDGVTFLTKRNKPYDISLPVIENDLEINSNVPPDIAEAPKIDNVFKDNLGIKFLKRTLIAVVGGAAAIMLIWTIVSIVKKVNKNKGVKNGK